MSIVSVILSLSSASPDLTEAQHAKALEYLSLNLSIRDRDEIIRVLCHHNPDHLTQAIRDGVNAYTPMIRQVHQAVDLSSFVGDFENFLTDMIKMSKPGSGKRDKGGARPPSVEDYVDLLHRYQNSTHRFLHQVAKNGKEVTQWFQDYCHDAAKEFQQPSENETSVTDSLNSAFQKLSAEDQTAVRKEIDAYAAYLDALHASSADRIRDVVSNRSSTAYGPGAYLARWQDLLDSTLITPNKAEGPVRTGGSKSVKEEARKDVDGEDKGGVSEKVAERTVRDKTPVVPGSEATRRLLKDGFRGLLKERLGS